MFREPMRLGIGFVVLVSSVAVACGPAPSSVSQGPVAPRQEQQTASKAGPQSQMGASEDWSKIVAAARQEGTLILSTHAGSGYEAYVERVKQALQELKIDATTMKASDFAARAIVEQQNGQYLWDIHMGPVSNIWSVVTPAGGLQSIKPFLDALPAEAKDSSKWAGGFELFTDPKNPVTLITQLSDNGGIYVNRELVPDGIARPEQLADPKWNGKIAYYDPTVANAGSMGLAGLLMLRGDEFVRKLIVENDAVFVATSRQLTEWIAQGRYPIGIGLDATQLAELQAKGVGTKVERNRTFGTYLLAFGTSVMKNAPHPNAIKVYLAWALSQEGQDVWAKYSSVDSNSRRLDVEVYHPDAAPDYKNLDIRSKTVLGTASGEDALNRVLEVAKSR